MLDKVNDWVLSVFVVIYYYCGGMFIGFKGDIYLLFMLGKYIYFFYLVLLEIYKDI